MGNRCLWIVAGVCLLWVITAVHLAEADDSVVRLGINYPLTGPYSVEGLDQIRAARMAVDEINSAGGILGKTIELMPADSGSDVLRTELNVRHLIDIGCSMVFGGSSSAVAIESARICAEKKTLFFGTLTYSTETTLEGATKFSFRECNNSWMSAKVMADWLNENYGGKRFYYITADYTWGWTTEKSFREVTDTTDLQRHGRSLLPLGSTDFTQALRIIKEDPPEVLVLVLFGKDLAFALRQVEQVGLKKACRIVVPNLTLGMAERAGASAIEGVVGTLPWSWKIPFLYNYPRGIRFVEQFVDRYHRYPSTSGASAYTIVYEYAAAVERAGGFAVEDVVRELEGHTYRILKDAQTWRTFDHQSVQTVYMVRGRNRTDVLADRLRLDFFEIMEGKPGPEIVRSEEEWKRLRREAGLLEALEFSGAQRRGEIQ